MSQKLIPEHIDPYRFAEQSLGLDGDVNISEMHRLSANVVDKEGAVKVSLTFGVDEQKVTFLRGQLQANLKLQCQRCMKSFNYEIISNFVLGIVRTLEEADQLPDTYEPALTKDNILALRDVIEDEIILNLPIIPRHEVADCEVKLPLKDKDWETTKNENPFQVLKVLKNK